MACGGKEEERKEGKIKIRKKRGKKMEGRMKERKGGWKSRFVR